jgi:hypothetical protein
MKLLCLTVYVGQWRIVILTILQLVAQDSNARHFVGVIDSLVGQLGHNREI